MEDYDLYGYFNDYLWETSPRKKEKIKEDFLNLIFNVKVFKDKRVNNILFGNVLQEKYNITTEQKNLLIKYCVGIMFRNFLSEKEYTKKRMEKNKNYATKLNMCDLYDRYIYDKRIEYYFYTTVSSRFYWLCSLLHNPKYIQCQNCGKVFSKDKINKYARNQKYCLDCSKTAASRRLKKFREKKKRF